MEFGELALSVPSSSWARPAIARMGILITAGFMLWVADFSAIGKRQHYY
jgi:hypothetical protein